MEKQYPVLKNTEENRVLVLKEDKCDKYDYLISVACGAVGGMVDVFLVGAPGDSKLSKWTDQQVDNVVMQFAKLSGWKPRAGKEGNISSAIGYLEKTYKVNYDQRHTLDVGGEFTMRPKDHHMKSLGHSPDIIGLFFSILNQFTSTSSFIADGRVITIRTDTHELQGHNFIAKLFCGIANWLGHIMSDIAGSSGRRGNGSRGSGVVAPFYELFQFCKFGSFKVGDARQDLATIAIRAFESGYDFRFAMTQAIPVVMTELSIRLIWSLRRHYGYGYPLKDCYPSSKHADLRMMILVGNGTLCVIDGLDAGIRSNGNFLQFFMRLNLVAWFRFVTLVIKEVCIRIGLKGSFAEQIEAFKRLNEALLEYLHELERIDKELFKKETEQYNKLVAGIDKIGTQEELNHFLHGVYEELGIQKAWKGDFGEHMSNKKATLVFE